MRNNSHLKTSFIGILALALLVSQTSLGWSQPEPASQLSARRASRQISFSVPSLLVADFDGDRILDQAELLSHGRRKVIQLNYSAAATTTLHFSTLTAQVGRLRTQDIDDDHDHDLIWIPKGRPEQSALWLNNGGGTFTLVQDTISYRRELEQAAWETNPASHLTRLPSKKTIATGPGAGFTPSRPRSASVELTGTIFSPDFYGSCPLRLSLSPTCHLKRGPPSPRF